MNTTAAKIATTGTHGLQIDTPTWGDYLKGGYGDLVAQCSCGQYEYVSSEQEGQYWHWLHRTNAGARNITLLGLLVENPMPEGWVEPSVATVPRLTPASRLGGRYTCPSCMGKGEVRIGGGTVGGRLYAYGAEAWGGCRECAGSGRTDRWVA